MTIAELLTLADEKPLLTDPEFTAEQRAKRASSCRFYVVVNGCFVALWVFLGIAHAVRHRQDDDILFWATFLMATLSSAFFARKYYLLMRGYQS